jgi:hypothetical protein
MLPLVEVLAFSPSDFSLSLILRLVASLATNIFNTTPSASSQSTQLCLCVCTMYSLPHSSRVLCCNCKMRSTCWVVATRSTSLSQGGGVDSSIVLRNSIVLSPMFCQCRNWVSISWLPQSSNSVSHSSLLTASVEMQHELQCFPLFATTF